jgi:hypothetical protein
MGGAKRQRALEQRMGELDAVRENLMAVLDEFRKDKRFGFKTFTFTILISTFLSRHLILEPWRPSFDPNHDPEQEIPPHRHLFHCYVYQYHLIQLSVNLTAMVMVPILSDING